MPSRWLTATIVVFWLAMTGWLFWRDLWPEWRPGEPPPFHIDLVEEVQRGNALKVPWIVESNSGTGLQKVFNASTWTEYHQEDDTFTLHAEFKTPFTPKSQQSENEAREPKPKVAVKRMKSEYRVNREGQLRSLRVDIHADIRGDLFDLDHLIRDAEASLWGEVHDGQFFAHYRLTLPDSNPFQGDLKPVPVSHHGSILMPLHPVNRIHGLHAGRTWRQALVDPFRDMFPMLSGLSGGTHYLQAHVLDQPQVLGLGKNATTCLVIEYTGEDVSAKTWVEQDSERVQRQEFTLGDKQWIIRRDTTNKRGL